MITDGEISTNKRLSSDTYWKSKRRFKKVSRSMMETNRDNPWWLLYKLITIWKEYDFIW